MREKSYEKRVRIAAKRQGLRLVKSRRRDRSADDYGLYVLVGDSRGNRLPGAQAPLSAFTDRRRRRSVGGRSGEPVAGTLTRCG